MTSPTHPAVPAPAASPAPICVTFVELEKLHLHELTDERTDGARFGSARIFFTRGGQLAGQADLPYQGGRISPDRIRAAAIEAGAADAPHFDPDDDDLPFATIATPTMFARGAALDRALTALSEQNYPADRFEILVVDNRGLHGQDPVQWQRLLDAYPLVRVLSEPQPGASAARNRALAEARGAVIAFTDDDAAADRDWLRRLVGRLVRTPDADCVTGPVLPAELETPAQIWFEESGSAPNRRFRPALYQTVAAGAAGTMAERFVVSDRLDAAVRRFPIYALGDMGAGANMAFRVDALRRLGGFDESLGPGTVTSAGGEDILLFLQVLFSGRGIVVEPTAYVRHWHRRTYQELREQIHGYGRAFTAMLLAAVIDDPRHVWGLARIIPAGTLAILGVRSEKTAGRSSGYPQDLHRAELVGMVGGPWSYLRSRRRARTDRAALRRAQSAA